MVFAIHRHESAMGVHVSLILNLPSHFPPHPIPQGHPSALALSARIEGILMNPKKKKLQNIVEYLLKGSKNHEGKTHLDNSLYEPKAHQMRASAI